MDIRYRAVKYNVHLKNWKPKQTFPLSLTEETSIKKNCQVEICLHSKTLEIRTPDRSEFRGVKNCKVKHLVINSLPHMNSRMTENPKHRPCKKTHETIF